MFTPQVLPGQGSGVLDAVRSFPTAGDAAMMSAEERAAWLFTLQQISDAAAAAGLDVLSVFDAQGDGERLHGARNTAAWLHSALRIAGADAKTRVRLAGQSRDTLAPVVDLLRGGEICYEHVKVISKSLRDVPAAQTPEAVALLRELARRASVEEVAGAGRHLREVVNPDGALAACQQDYTRRRLYLSPLLDGMVAVEGLFDAEAGAVLTTALQPFLVPADPTDDRDTAQRRADGLVELAHLAMTQARLPVAGGSRPVVNVLATLDTLTAAPGQPGGAGAGASLPETGGMVGTITAQRIACDAHLARVLLDGDAVPVALGRTQRLFTAAQRKLLALRDGGCRFPGCGLPPAFTDAHHLHPWQHGGTTDLTNAILVCRFHHRRLHEGRWAVYFHDRFKQPGGALTFTGPDGQRLESPPRSVTAQQLATTAWWAQPPDHIPRT